MPYEGREDAQTMPFSLAITFLLISIESLLLRKWLKFHLHKGISTLIQSRSICRSLFCLIRFHLRLNIVGGFYTVAKVIKLNVLRRIIKFHLNKCSKVFKKRGESIKTKDIQLKPKTKTLKTCFACDVHRVFKNQ